jgi:AcrR family transcriptional regulator
VDGHAERAQGGDPSRHPRRGLRLSVDTGLAGLSLRSVAKAVGVVPTAFYRHFA